MKEIAEAIQGLTILEPKVNEVEEWSNDILSCIIFVFVYIIVIMLCYSSL